MKTQEKRRGLAPQRSEAQRSVAQVPVPEAVAPSEPIAYLIEVAPSIATDATGGSEACR